MRVAQPERSGWIQVCAFAAVFTLLSGLFMLNRFRNPSARPIVHVFVSLPVATACSLGLMFSPVKAAEYTLSASQDVKFVDNVLRTAKADAKSDTEYVPAVNLGAILSTGAHRWTNQLQLSRHHFSSTSDMDHNAYSLLSDFKWQSGSYWTGAFGIRAVQQHSNYYSDGLNTAIGLNLQATQAAYFNAQYGGRGELTLGFKGDTQKINTQKSGVVRDDTSQSSIKLFANWAPSERVGAYMECGYTDNQRKQPSVSSSNYSRCDVSVGGYLVRTGVSQIDLRLGQTELFGKNVSSGGWSGSVKAVWAPSAQWKFNAGLDRLIGATTNYSNLGTSSSGESVLLSTLGGTVDTKFSLGGTWLPTSKLTARLNFNESRRKTDNQYSVLGFSTTAVTEDKFRFIRAEVIYAMNRKVSTSAAWQQDRRIPTDSSVIAGFQVSTLTANLQYQFW